MSKNFVLYTVGKDLEHKPTLLKFYAYDVRGVEAAKQSIRDNSGRQHILRTYRLEPAETDFVCFSIGDDGKTISSDRQREQDWLATALVVKEPWYEVNSN